MEPEPEPVVSPPPAPRQLRASHILLGAAVGFIAVDFLSLGVLSSLAIVIPGFLWTGGEWHRLVLASFLHADVPHLVANFLLLFAAATVAEQLYGRARVVLAYVVAGLVGGVASAALLPSAAVATASGGSFGLVGLVLGLSLLRRAFQPAALDPRAALWIAAGVTGNLILGVLGPSVNNVAHAAGLGAGCLLSLVLEPRLETRPRPVLGLAAALLLVAGLGAGLLHSAKAAGATLAAAFVRAADLELARRFEPAIATLEEGFARVPSGSADELIRPAAQNLLAWLYVEAGQNFERGIELSRESNRTRAKEPAFLDTLGYLYAMAGQCRDAADAMGQAVDLDRRYRSRRDAVNEACKAGARPDPDVPFDEPPAAPTPPGKGRGIRV